MFPLIRFVALFGGVAASAQIAAGAVRGVKELCRGRPVAGLLEFADGMASPILTAVSEVSKCVKEVHDAVTLPWKQEEPKEEPKEETLPPVNRCTQEPREQERELLNGVVAGVKS
jgi:hypothetical protein